MPTIPFDASRRVILVRAMAHAIDGRPAELNVLVDTGAGRTGFRRSTLIGLGIDVDASEQTIRLNTASESLTVPVVNLPILRVFGVDFLNMPVLCLPLPPTVPADGVLGFDVLSRFRLFVNYKRGLLVAEPFGGFLSGAKFLWQVAKAM
jgi:predicted aspartyl protease